MISDVKKWMLAGAACLSLLSMAWLSAAQESTLMTSTSSPSVATQRALERLIRSTRRDGMVRQPFILRDAPPEEEVLIDSTDDLGTAILLIEEEDYANAVPLLERVLKDMPTVEAIWEALGWSYFRTDRIEDAKTLWNQYLTLRPDSPKPYTLLAQLAIVEKDWRDVDTYLLKSLELDPNNFETRYWYAQNEFRLGRLAHAQELFEELIKEQTVDGELQDEGIPVLMDLARVYTHLQMYDEALDAWAFVMDYGIELPSVRLEYARASMMVGNMEEADTVAREIMSEYPDSIYSVPAMGIRADVAELSQQDEVMVESLRHLLNETDSPYILAQLHMRLANRYVALHNKDAAKWPINLALDHFKEAVDRRPDNVSWMMLYAQSALLGKHPAIAQRLVTRILEEYNPYNRHALDTQFEIYMTTKSFDAAERAIEARIEKFDPKNPYQFLDRARLEIQRGRYIEALDALERLEEASNRGTVVTLLYHGITESEWLAQTSSRRFYEHMLALLDAGFTFISPFDVPAYLEANKRDFEPRTSKPWLARQVDNVKYAFTGRREEVIHEDIRPMKVVAITFDDGLRSSFELATPVGQELGLTFGMFVITMIDELVAPMYSTWEEIRGWMDSGVWEIGSHLYHAHQIGYVDEPEEEKEEEKALKGDGLDDPEELEDEDQDEFAGEEVERLEIRQEVHPLVNRLWLDDKGRMETMREWTRRVRKEFAYSRELIQSRLGLSSNEVTGVAYPYGDVGQEDSSNIAARLNPVRTVLNEALREYSVGFTADDNGYTFAGDNPMMIRRYEPPWDMEGEQLAESVLSRHPVFMARRMRAEIAVLMDRPHLADKQIELLRRDGYPESALRDLVALTQNKAVSTLQASSGADAEVGGASVWRLRPRDLAIGAAYRENKSNEQIEQDYYEINASLNLNAKMGLNAYYRDGTIKQTVTSNFWYKITRDETQSSVETRTERVNGVASTTVTEIETVSTREVQTNRIEKYKYKADVQELRVGANININESAGLTGSFGQKTVKFRSEHRDNSSEDEFIYNLAAAWRPFRTLQVLVGYDHDLVPSAREIITYDAFSLNALWKVADDWDINSKAIYYNYEDDNALFSIYGSSFWQIFARQGIWLGLEGSVYSMDEHSELYWTPYWDTRFAGVLRLKRSYQQYFFQFDIRLGMQEEKARPEDEDEYLNLLAQATNDGSWYPGSSPAAPWDTFIGLSGTYSQRIWRHWEFLGSINVNFLRDYSEHDFTIGLKYHF